MYEKYLASAWCDRKYLFNVRAKKIINDRINEEQSRQILPKSWNFELPHLNHLKEKTDLPLFLSLFSIAYFQNGKEWKKLKTKNICSSFQTPSI